MSDAIPLFQVDAFTDVPFAGNPAAVCLNETWLPDDVMQQIAAENNLSETAFLVPLGEDWALRWFTPTCEVDLCGHATLASAFVLYDQLQPEADEIRFHTQSGVLEAFRSGKDIVLDFPTRAAQACAPSTALATALGAEPRELLKAKHWFLAVYERESDVAALAPSMAALAALDGMGVIATAPGDEVDFVSRCFCPAVGVSEDPVTGSAHCTLTPYWSERLGKKKLKARQISARGGSLRCEDRGERTLIGGRAVLVLRGEFFPDAETSG